MLQTTAVFANVSKGVLAKREDLLLVFGTDDTEAICMRILAEGEVQVGERVAWVGRVECSRGKGGWESCSLYA